MNNTTTELKNFSTRELIDELLMRSLTENAGLVNAYDKHDNTIIIVGKVDMIIGRDLIS